MLINYLEILPHPVQLINIIFCSNDSKGIKIIMIGQNLVSLQFGSGLSMGFLSPKSGFGDTWVFLLSAALKNRHGYCLGRLLFYQLPPDNNQLPFRHTRQLPKFRRVGSFLLLEIRCGLFLLFPSFPPSFGKQSQLWSWVWFASWSGVW